MTSEPKAPLRVGRASVWLLCALSLGLVMSAYATPDQDRLLNLSTRAKAGTGSDLMIAGFVVGPGPAKPFLIRAIGPTLGLFNLKGTLADPQITLLDSNARLVAANDNWTQASGAFFSDVGAFALPAGSADASFVATLGPGSYTAQVTGGSGLSIVEVYDLSDQTRMINLSTRGYVGAGDDTMIAGVVNSNTLQKRRVLIRGIGPALGLFRVTGFVADPFLTVFDGTGKVVASNDDWDPALATDFTASGAFQLPVSSKDAALVMELDQGAYTVHLNSKDGTPGVGLIEAYDLNPQAAAYLSLAAATPTTRLGDLPAVITLSRTGDLNTALTVPLVVGGSATPGEDYAALPENVTFDPGAATATLFVDALPTPNSGSHTVTVTVAPAAAYALTGPSTVVASILTGEGTLYIANLRPEETTSSSVAFGASVLQLSGDEHFLSLNLSFSNLSSSETVAYLRMVTTEGFIVDLRRIPTGQIDSYLWQISDVGTITAAEIVSALKAGRVYLELQSTAFPAGELSGRYAAVVGSTEFSAPLEPPTLPVGAPTAADASRFLIQATFGPDQEAIDALQVKGLGPWLDEQMTTPASLHQAAILEDFTLFPPTAGATKPSRANRVAAWWKIALKGNDQLRQRAAFALSELLVVSDYNDTVGGNEEAAAKYYDILVRNALGNYRTLLDEVSRSPIMGIYLSSLRNSKANAKTGAQPDENYAREVMQLFTVGLWVLHPDGTLKLDAAGNPIPTFDQSAVSETAKVFTGWGFQSTEAKPGFWTASADWLNPMMVYPDYHDVTEKHLAGGLVLPAGQTGEQDLKDTLDFLFQHPSTAPFVSKQLIQRLVTSNPSPAYVYRVARVFEDNGSGVRGDLGAVFRAILTDYEARSATVTGNAGFGKLKEPLLRVSAFCRALHCTATNDRYAYVNPETDLLQGPLRSPTVFNFFEPSYIPKGVLSDAGLMAPEFEILNAATAISVANRLYSFTYASSSTGIALDWTAYLPLATTPEPLIDALAAVLCGGSVSPETKARIVVALQAVPKSSTALERVRMAAYLLVTTSAAAVQH